MRRPTGPSIFVAAPYGSLDDALPVLLDTPIEAIGLDLVKGAVPTGVATDKVLVGGVIDGHNIWRGDLAAACGKLEALEGLASKVAVATSTSLFHTPHDVDDEPLLGAQLKSWLAFADQKVGQVATLAKGLTAGKAAIQAELDAASAALADRHAASGVRDGAVRARAAHLVEADFSRGDYAARLAAQEAALNLPFLPTTTIGSFPQTGEIRKARAAAAKGDITQEQYADAMQAEIRRVVDLQEEIGLDVIVHGEPERNDMVQYFAETARRVRGHPERLGAVVRLPLYAPVDPVGRRVAAGADDGRVVDLHAVLTAKPVKGMLTGPVTILAWSFVRDDQPLRDTANQVALALRDEIADLESAGIGIVQVDEPALRELLPLKQARPGRTTSTGRSARSASRPRASRTAPRSTRTSATRSSAS